MNFMTVFCLMKHYLIYRRYTCSYYFILIHKHVFGSFISKFKLCYFFQVKNDADQDEMQYGGSPGTTFQECIRLTRHGEFSN